MYSVRKRNGNLVAFSLEKIISAIRRAFEATGTEYTDDVLNMLALQVTSGFQSKIQNGAVSVEDIQDTVESVLGQAGYHEVAKSYIIYRRNHEAQRNMKSAVLDYQKVVDGYLKLNDWRVKENSTVQYSLGGLILSNSGAVTANYWLSQVYDKETADAHRSCDFHIHDLSMLSGYCAGWSLKQLIQEGLGGVEGKITSLPASHLITLCNQMVNFLGILQNEWAGAQAFSSFDTYLAPFVRADNLTYKEVKQAIQAFIFGVNTPSRWGCVKETTRILTPDGWKTRSELNVGDMIYTWVNGTLHEAPLKHIIHHKNDYGVLHRYKGVSYQQTVSPEHRCLVESGKARGEYIIKQSQDIFRKRCDLRMPVCIKDADIHTETELSDEEVRLAAMYYTDGNSDLSNMEISKSVLCDDGAIKEVLDTLNIRYSVYEQKRSETQTLRRYHIWQESADYVKALIGQKADIDEKFLHLSPEQSRLFVKTWASFDGNANDRIACQYDNEAIREKLELIFIRAGYMPHRWSRKKAEDKKATDYLYADTKLSVVITEQEEIPYDGMVWCPNTDDGTAIYKDEDGYVFISGNCQAPFTNITLDWVCPNDLKNLPAIVGGKEMPFTYGDCQKEMDMVNKAFLEIMIEGDANGRGFQYPIPTYSITKDFDWSDTENNRLLFEMTAKYGTPYFSNYINSDMEPSDVRSMCCRLRLDLRELRKKSGGYFGSGESTGSVGVVTLNMPRLAYLSKDEADFWKRLDRLMDIAAKSLKVKRTFITKLLDEGLYPYTKRYLGTFNNHFSTIGLVGMNECCLNANWIRADLTDAKAQDFTEKVLNHMRERLSDYQEKYGDLYNLEATPAESTTYRFAKHDREQFPDIITASENDDAPYYTNSSHLPVGYTDDIFSALDIQDRFQTLYTSGTVFHAFLGEKMPDWQSAATLVRKIAENYRLPYFTLSPTYSVCRNHGYIAGEQWKCPVCGKPTEVYSRITGYYRPVKNWNAGKTEEFRERKTYDIGNSHLRHDGPADPKNGDAAVTHDEESAKDADPILLFTTKTCPNCRIAKAKLDDAGIAYTVIDAEEHPELTNEYGVCQAPTLVKDGTAYAGLSAILGMLRG